MNYLMLSVGRRGELMKCFRVSMENGSRIIATDNSPYATAVAILFKVNSTLRGFRDRLENTSPKG